MENHSEVIYMHTNIYNPKSEKGIKFDDPTLGINWPIKKSIISDRDLSFSPIANEFNGL